MDLRTASGLFVSSVEHRIAYLPIGDVPTAESNPKLHDIPGIKASIRRFGFVTPGLIDGRTGRMIVGHGRREALTEMCDEGDNPPRGIRTDPTGQWLIPCITGWSSNSDAEADAYLITDNQGTINGGWAERELRDLLTSIEQADPSLIELTGVDVAELDDLIRANRAPDLDELAETLGDPHPSDSWPTIHVSVPPHVAAAWRSHLSTFDDQDAEAFASLLGVEVEP